MATACQTSRLWTGWFRCSPLCLASLAARGARLGQAGLDVALCIHPARLVCLGQATLAWFGLVEWLFAVCLFFFLWPSNHLPALRCYDGLDRLAWLSRFLGFVGFFILLYFVSWTSNRLPALGHHKQALCLSPCWEAVGPGSAEFVNQCLSLLTLFRFTHLQPCGGVERRRAARARSSCGWIGLSGGWSSQAQCQCVVSGGWDKQPGPTAASCCCSLSLKRHTSFHPCRKKHSFNPFKSTERVGISAPFVF